MSDQSRTVSRSTVVPVPPQQVFALLADPGAHPAIDGSRTVKAVVAPAVVRAIGIPRRADRALAATLDGLQARFAGARAA